MQTPQILIIIIVYNTVAVFNKNIDNNNVKLINNTDELSEENRVLYNVTENKQTPNDVKEAIYEGKSKFNWIKHVDGTENVVMRRETQMADIERSTLQDDLERDSKPVKFVDNIRLNREKSYDFKQADQNDDFIIGLGGRIGLNPSEVNHPGKSEFKLTKYEVMRGIDLKGKENIEMTFLIGKLKESTHRNYFGRNLKPATTDSKKNNEDSFDYDVTDFVGQEVSKEVDSDAKFSTMNHKRVSFDGDKVLKHRKKRDDDDIPWIWSTCPDGRHYEVVDGSLTCVLDHLGPCVVLDDRALFGDNNKCAGDKKPYRLGNRIVCLKKRRRRH